MEFADTCPTFSFIIFHTTDASRSRQALSNEYLIAKFRYDTAENGPSKVSDNMILR